MAPTSTAAPLLDSLCDWAERQGVTLSLFERALDCWEIHSIERDPDAPAGVGRVVIERIQREAHTAGCSVVLMVVGLNSALMDYYVQLGFQPDGASDEDTGDQGFRWLPQAPATTARARRPRA